MIKVISFDIGGTIIEEKKSNNADLYSLENLALLVDKPYDEVRLAYKNVFQKKKGNLGVLISCFCDILDINKKEDLYEFFKNKFNLNDDGRISNETINLIKDLKQKGYKIIFFSNACCLLNNSIKGDMLKYVDNIYYSYDLGYTKNEKESYKIIEKELGYKPDEFLHIGDNLKSDYICPKKYGWNALFYTHEKSDEHDCISRLEDIYKYL